MKLPEDAHVLRIYCGESDRRDGRPLYETIVLEAKKQGLAGATVLRGISGFGANSRVHTTKILRLSEDLPVVIEIVDSPEKIDAFLPWLDQVIGEGMIVRQKVQVLAYRHNNGN